MHAYKANLASRHAQAFSFCLMLSVRRRRSPTAISTKTLGVDEDGRSLAWTTAHTAVSVRVYTVVQVCFTCHHYWSLFADRVHNERDSGYSSVGKLTGTPLRLRHLGEEAKREGNAHTSVGSCKSRDSCYVKCKHKESRERISSRLQSHG
jgi:hypothetical protein